MQKVILVSVGTAPREKATFGFKGQELPEIDKHLSDGYKVKDIKSKNTGPDQIVLIFILEKKSKK